MPDYCHRRGDGDGSDPAMGRAPWPDVPGPGRRLTSRYARPTWASFVELMDYGVGQSVSRVGVIMANQVDNLVVGRWLGAVPL